MGMWNFLSADGTSMHTPLTAAEVRNSAKTFEYTKEWHCKCGARLKIRSRDRRDDGPSNFAVFPAGHPKAGQPMVSAGALNWRGLAVERGWQVEKKVVCPACRAGLSVAEYKAKKRLGQ